MLKHELLIIVGFLDELSDKFSNDGCNDFYLKDTPENRELVLAAQKYCNYDEELYNIRDNKILTNNTVICSYLKNKLEKSI